MYGIRTLVTFVCLLLRFSTLVQTASPSSHCMCICKDKLIMSSSAIPPQGLKVERGNFGHMRTYGQQSSKAKFIEQCGYNCNFSTRSS